MLTAPSARPPGGDEARRWAAEALARRAPPLRFVDPGLASGMEFRLAPRDRRGRASSRDVAYQVAARPTVSVLRNDP